MSNLVKEQKLGPEIHKQVSFHSTLGYFLTLLTTPHPEKNKERSGYTFYDGEQFPVYASYLKILPTKIRTPFEI